MLLCNKVVHKYRIYIFSPNKKGPQLLEDLKRLHICIKCDISIAYIVPIVRTISSDMSAYIQYQKA